MYICYTHTHTHTHTYIHETFFFFSSRGHTESLGEIYSLLAYLKDVKMNRLKSEKKENKP